MAKWYQSDRVALAGLSAVFVAVYAFTKPKKRGYNLTSYGADQLGEFFTIDEFVRSAEASNYEITAQNFPPDQAVENGVLLAQLVLDPLRRVNGKIHINSWWRSDELINLLIQLGYGASKDSTHTTGGTADIDAIETDNFNLVSTAIAENLPFDRILLEGGTTYKPDWIHIEYNPDLSVNDQRRLIFRVTQGTTGYYLNENEIEKFV